MKSLYFLLFFIFFYQNILAQTQNICFADVKYYSVDLIDGPAGTSSSTYAWSVLQPSFAGTIVGKVTPTVTNANAITINWGATVAGTYTLRVIETNNGCSASPIDLTVIINPLPATPIVTAFSTPICAGTDAKFTITGIAGLQVSYAINSGPTQTTTLDATGNKTITITAATASQTLVISQVSNAICTLTAITGLSANVIVNPLPVTSSINFN